MPPRDRANTVKGFSTASWAYDRMLYYLAATIAFETVMTGLFQASTGHVFSKPLQLRSPPLSGGNSRRQK